MKLVKVILGGLMLAAAPLAALAEDMSYSYVEVGYVDADLADVASGDGPSLRGSANFAEKFFAFGEYTTLDFPGGVDLDQYVVGLGGHFGIFDNADFVGRVGYTEFDVSVPGLGSGSADGYVVSAGIRGQVAEDFELEGHVIHTDLGSDLGDSTGFVVGGRYFFTGSLAIGLEYRTGDEIGGEDLDLLSAHVRFAF